MEFKKILGFAIGPLGAAALGLVAVPLTAWLFSPEDVGRLNLFQITVSFGLLLFVLGLDAAFVREYHGCHDLPALLKACFLPGFLMLSVGSIAAATYASELSFGLFKISNPLIYPLVAIAIMLNYISRFLSLILRMQERGLAYSMSEIIPRALQLLLLFGIYWFELHRNFITLLWISVASTLAVVLLYAWNTRDQWQPALTARTSAELQKSLLRFGTPLVFSGLAYWGLTATSSLVLRRDSTLSELGLYSVTNSFAAAAAILQSIFTVVWAPTIYKWINEGVDMARLDKIAHQALGVVCLIFCLVGSFSWLTDYLLPEYYINVKYLLVCAVAPTLLYALSEITSVGIGVTRRTTLTIWITLAAVAINILISNWLVPDHGAAGAVIANAMAYIVFFIGRTEVSAKVWRQFPRVRLYIHVMVFIALAITTVLLGPVLPFHYSTVWLAALPLLALSFKAELDTVVVFVRKAQVMKNR